MHTTALEYVVDTIVSSEASLDKDLVTKILSAGIPLYTNYFGDGDVVDLRQKISSTHIDSGFTREKAYPLLDQASVIIGVLLSRAHEAEALAEEAGRQPWPQWADDIFKRLKAVGLYDGVDWSEGVDLGTDFQEWVDEYEATCKRSTDRLERRVATLEGQLAEKQTLFAQGLIAPAQEAALRVLAEKAAYFRRTDGHYDRTQAAGSYDATRPEVERAIRQSMEALIQAAGGRVDVKVVDYRQSDEAVKYLVQLEIGERSLTAGMYDIRGRAEFEAAEWEWLLCGGAQPDIDDFDVDAAESIAAVSAENDPRILLEEVRRAVFGDLGSSPDVYADYDRLTELSHKMSTAIATVRTIVDERQRVMGELSDAKGMLLRTADERMGKAFYVEVCRAEDRINDIASLARVAVEKVPSGQIDDDVTRLLRIINQVEDGKLVPDQPSRVEMALAAKPDDLRAQGWTVAVHNDYRLDGVAHTFWLFTKGNTALKGEGLTDAEALEQVRSQVRWEKVRS